METMSFEVVGMHCQKCEERLVKMLSQAGGVNEVKASAQEGRVEVTGEGLDRAALAAAIEDAGFDVK